MAAYGKWKDQLQHFQQSNEQKDLFGIDGEPLEFGWNFSEIHNIADSPRDSRQNGSLSNIFMSMFNDIDWTKIEKYNECSSNSATIKNCAKRFPLGHIGLFSVQEKKENCMERTITNLERK